jgi:hypothetical protein
MMKSEGERNVPEMRAAIPTLLSSSLLPETSEVQNLQLKLDKLESSCVLFERNNVCEIRGFRGGNYEEWRLLGCYAVWLL